MPLGNEGIPSLIAGAKSQGSEREEGIFKKLSLIPVGWLSQRLSESKLENMNGTMCVKFIWTHWGIIEAFSSVSRSIRI